MTSRKSKGILIAVTATIVTAFSLAYIFMQPSDVKSENSALFKLIPADSSGIHFTNTIVSSDSLNIFNFEYIYNGGGVGIGDFDNDGFQDIFLGGNMVSGKLYLNRGNLQFADVTEGSGIRPGDGWTFGVAVADVDGNGLSDIYLSIGGPGNHDIYPNKLYLNQGVNEDGFPRFVEMASEYNLADSGQSVQSVFFDFDGDGDLDMYLLTGGGFEKSPIIPYPVINDGTGRNTDRLYRNDFDETLGHPVFTDISLQAGVVHEGFGLGVSITDINDDSWPDIFVTNDYLSNDHLYINNGNGTFTERSSEYFKHTSHFAMGNDVGDINNDGLFDLISVDMLPDDRYSRALMFGPNQYDKFHYSINQGYTHQYMRNTLQVNRGRGKFSEIGQMAGLYKTSWSWAVLFADLDNDGYQDVFITNGFGKDITDLDFVKYRSNLLASGDKNRSFRILMDSLSSRPGIKTHPYVYRNNGDYTFSDVSEQWGFTFPTYSNGAAYVDLDNDGDLDIITNNINEQAHLYQNNTIGDTRSEDANFLRVHLAGAHMNREAIGSRVEVWNNNTRQVRYMNTIRGFESSVEPIVHFGLNDQAHVDSVLVVWPDRKRSVIKDVDANQVLAVHYKEASNNILRNQADTGGALFEQLPPSALGIRYVNKQNAFNDFNYERLLPRKYSQSGPAIAVADINGDGLEDFFVGGAYQQSGEIYVQNRDGSFHGRKLSEEYDWSGDAGCLFFDADGDGDADLYVVSGGNEFGANNGRYQDRLYKNDGKGNFRKDTSALPKMISSGSCVVAADYDSDGDLDLFVGGAVVPGSYPETPVSYLLRNDGGAFRDVTGQIAPGLRNAGMVTAALWTDINNDHQPDLLVVGEWMPISVFKNDGGRFSNVTAAAGLGDTEGWWQSMVSGDYDNDGDIDYVVGNWGLNNPYFASVTNPMKVCYKDFDQNGSMDPIVCYYEDGDDYPVASWDILIEQLPLLRKQIPNYARYASTSMKQLLGLLNVKDMKVRQCKTLTSSFIENRGGGQFTIKELPADFQFSPVYGMLSEDVNNDGNLDLLSVGNFYGTDVVVGRYDAFMGLIMIGDGQGNFSPVPCNESGFVVDGNGKGLIRIDRPGKSALLIAGQNGDSLKVFQDRQITSKQLLYPARDESYALVTLRNGQTRRKEFGYGTSYFSQSSRSMLVTKDVTAVALHDNQGSITRRLEFK